MEYWSINTFNTFVYDWKVLTIAVTGNAGAKIKSWAWPESWSCKKETSRWRCRHTLEGGPIPVTRVSMAGFDTRWAETNSLSVINQLPARAPPLVYDWGNLSGRTWCIPARTIDKRVRDIQEGRHTPQQRSPCPDRSRIPPGDIHKDVESRLKKRKLPRCQDWRLQCLPRWFSQSGPPVTFFNQLR